MEPKPLRLFVALDFGEAIKRAVGREVVRLSKTAPDARWINPEAAHLTLVFLGWVPESQRQPIALALESVAQKYPPMVLGLKGVGTFGSAKRPRVLWAGVTGEVNPLMHLQANLVTAFTPLGHKPEARPFHPHLTLSRAKEPRGDARLALCARQAGDVSFGEVRIERVILFRSKLSSKGALYSLEATAALQAHP